MTRAGLYTSAGVAVPLRGVEVLAHVTAGHAETAVHQRYRNDGRAAILAAQDNPNLYLGTTIAAFEPPFVATAVQEVGPERVIFGSNLPLLYPDLALEALRRARLGAEVEALIFGGNLACLLDLNQ